MKVVMKTMYALPCEFEKFTINGMPANYSDFGDTIDDRESLEEDGYDEDSDVALYGCCNFKFITDPNLKDSAMQKYNLTENEYKEVCEKLEDILYIGECGWCI